VSVDIFAREGQMGNAEGSHNFKYHEVSERRKDTKVLDVLFLRLNLRLKE
jgi:hypothetical protein